MKLKLDQEGFGLVGGLLITVVLTLVVGVGFYVVNASKDKKEETISSNAQNQYQGGRKVELNQALQEISSCNVSDVNAEGDELSLNLKAQGNEAHPPDYVVFDRVHYDSIVSALRENSGRCGEVEIFTFQLITLSKEESIEKIKTCRINEVSIANRNELDAAITMEIPEEKNSSDIVKTVRYTTKLEYQEDIIKAVDEADQACEGLYLINHNDF